MNVLAPKPYNFVFSLKRDFIFWKNLITVSVIQKKCISFKKKCYLFFSIISDTKYRFGFPKSRPRNPGFLDTVKPYIIMFTDFN